MSIRGKLIHVTFQKTLIFSIFLQPDEPDASTNNDQGKFVYPILYRLNAFNISYNRFYLICCKVLAGQISQTGKLAHAYTFNPMTRQADQYCLKLVLGLGLCQSSFSSQIFLFQIFFIPSLNEPVCVFKILSINIAQQEVPWPILSVVAAKRSFLLC